MSIADDVNSVVKQKKITPKIPELNPQSDRDASRNVGQEPAVGDSISLIPPLTYTELTYDETKNIELKDSLGNPVTDAGGNPLIITTAKTGMITDAENNEFLIETIILDESVPAEE